MENVPTLSEPDLLRYLNGEISFETWLCNQNIDYAESQDNNPLVSSLKEASESLNLGCRFPDDESAMFSSWGRVFTSEHEKKQEVKQIKSPNKRDQIEGESILELKNTIPPADSKNFLSAPLREVSFANVPHYNLEEQDSLQGVEIQPLMIKLPSIISTSTANKKIKSKKHKEHDIFQDLHNFQFRKRAYGVRQKMSEMARLQLGQANLLVAKGDFKQAADICMEVVKEVPSSGEPFKTLSFIYDEQGDKEMALQYALVSAFLDCKDAQEWRDLAQRCIAEGSETQALACYDRACKVLATDACLQWDRATMYFEKQDYRKTLDILFTIMKLITPTYVEDYMVIAKEISKLYHKIGLIDRSKEMLEAAYKLCANIKDYEGIHLLCEMYMGTKEYFKLLKLLVKTCEVKLPEDIFKLQDNYVAHKSALDFLKTAAQVSSSHFTDLSSKIVEKLAVTSAMTIEDPNKTLEDGGSKKAVSQDQPVNGGYYIPVDLPLDIRVKLAQCLIYSNELNYVENIVGPLLSEDVNEVGDLMLDLAEAYFETGNYHLSLKYLLELVECAKFNQAAVWLKVAESFDCLNENEKSIEAYYMVLSLAPQHVSVRMTLATLLRGVGRADEAMTVISEYDQTFNDKEAENPSVSELNKLKVEECELLYKKCMTLYAEGNIQEFLCDGYILIHNYLLWSFGYQKQMLIGRAQMWQFLLQILNVAMDLKEYQKAFKLVSKAMLFKPYQESRKYRLELDYLQTTIFFVAGEYSKAFDSFRVLITHETDDVIDKNTIWNLFALITNKMMDKRHHRYVLRLLFRKPSLVPLIIMNGNNSFVSGTYKYAIGEYSRCFREWPTNPLNSLLLAVSYLHLSCQKFHKTRHTSIIQGLVFMFQYMSLRKENQESLYNMGRAFHQIGLVHFASFYYNKALEFPLHNENDGDKAEYHPFIDLHREAACNLAMIYKASGNIELAKKTLYKYCWV